MPASAGVQGKFDYGFLLLAALIAVPLTLVRMLSDPRRLIVETIALLLATSIFYLVSVWWLLQKETLRRPLPPLALILGAGILFRVIVFPFFPDVSDDLYRYRWEGKMQSAGFDPYATRPDDPRLGPLRDNMYSRISGKEFRAVYGPLLQLEERAFYVLESALTPDAALQVFWFKLPAALADLGLIAAIITLLKIRGVPAQRVLIYAWCPLPVFEFWVAGHNDAIVLLFIILALILAARSKLNLAALALSLATLAKFWPALLFPSLTGYRLKRVAPAAAILACATAVVVWPYRDNIAANARFTSGFLGGWRNNDSLHGITAALAGDPYRAKYITMALMGGAALVIAALRCRLEARTLALIVCILALSANVHPWYVAWLVPLLPFYPISGLMLWTALAPLSYQALIEWTTLGEWNGNTPIRWLIYAPVAGVLLFNWLSSRRRYSRSDARAPHSLPSESPE